MKHKLATTIVSYNRPELLKRTIESYLDTVTLPHVLHIVDNASDWDTRKYLRRLPRGTATVVLLNENRYPGAATNHGWSVALKSGATRITLLHRSDNDVEYLPGWCDEVSERFEAWDELGQLGLRTVEEEGEVGAVGGNCVIRRKVWDAGVRYASDGWDKVPFEDGHMSGAVQVNGWQWQRVQRPCIVHIGLASRDDPYYQRTFAERRIEFASYGL